MAQLKLGAAGVTANEIDISGPSPFVPTGIPAGVVGTSKQGPAFVPITLGRLSDFEAKFGSVDSKHFGPMAVLEWLRNARAVTFLRVLGIGDGLERQSPDGDVPGSVTNAGFVVGEELPNDSVGKLDYNPYANQSYSFGGILAAAATATITTDDINENAGVAPGGDESRGFELVDSFNNALRILIDPTGGLGQTPHGFAELVSGAGGSNGVYRVFVGTNGGATAAAFAQQIADAINIYLPAQLMLLGGGQVWDASASVMSNVITVTQGTAGTAGNTAHVEYDLPTIDNSLVVTDFSGGIDAVAPTVYNGDLGRTYFLGCFMSESAGSTFFSDASIQSGKKALPIVRGVLMAPSGVLLTLSSSLAGVNSDKPASTDVGDPNAATLKGSFLGSVALKDGTTPKQEFVMLLNGHKGLDANNPNVLTASFDVTSNNYFASVFNKDPFMIQQKGHFLYANWDVHPSQAALTGSGMLAGAYGADAGGAPYGKAGLEQSAFLLTSSVDRNDGTATIPNYENFEDRFRYAKSPWVISQKFGGKPVNLFRLHALDAGQDISSLYKISVENITPSADPANKYGSFTIKVRKWSDRDNLQSLMATGESFTVDLNPTSNRYIAKVVGDVNAYFDFDRDVEEQKLVIEGSYPNKSNYIRVEVHPDIENGFVDPTALPMGFRGIDHLVTSGSIFPVVSNPALSDTSALRQLKTPPLPMRRKVTDGVVNSQTEAVNSKFYWGTQFEHVELITKPNASVLPNASLKSFAKYFPDFATVDMPFVVGDNTGVPDTADNGILDADRFCNNLFSLEHVQVVTGSGASATADPLKWASAVYVRQGNIPDADAGTRALSVKDLRETANRVYAKFTFFLQGGFNGVNLFDEDEFNMTNRAVSEDMYYGNERGLNDGPNVKVYQKAIDIMKNTTNLDIQLLAIPGLRHPIITDYATVATQERFDALYLMDIEQYKEEGTEIVNEVLVDGDITSVSNTVTSFRDRNIDSSFAAAYFPDVLYSAPDGNNVFVPPSVLVLGALALNDAVGHPWFAPAGFTRGALPQLALEARVKLKDEDLDTLYNERINPLIAFVGSPKSGTNPASGLVVWGQKTLQLAASALDRVNVRRLLIEIRRQVRDIAQTILFEPNREATLARFSAAVTPRLQRIQALAGLERFRVIIDSSTTTQTDVENNTVRGKIYVQPTKSIEFVSLDFVVANNLQQVT